jgi:hypothetical protein
MKRKLRIVIDAGDTFCGKCEHALVFLCVYECQLFRVDLGPEDSKPKRHAKCLEAEGLR